MVNIRMYYVLLQTSQSLKTSLCYELYVNTFEMDIPATDRFLQKYLPKVTEENTHSLICSISIYNIEPTLKKLHTTKFQSQRDTLMNH
jgi:hypothetical protein